MSTARGIALLLICAVPAGAQQPSGSAASHGSRARDSRSTPRDLVWPLPRLEGSFAGLSAGDASLAYAESAVAVRALLDQAGAPAVVSLLGDVGRGMPFPDAFQRNILMSYTEFQKKLQD